MSGKPLTTIGYLLNSLHISTVSLSHAIHVDPSLVSKWKNGSRTLSEKADYYEELMTYILEESESDDYLGLKNVLQDLYPGCILNTQEQLKFTLRRALSTRSVDSELSHNQQLAKETNASTTLSFVGKSGIRSSYDMMLSYAENMEEPGNLIIMEADYFSWLLEEADFAKSFVKRICTLLNKGFHFQFILKNELPQKNFEQFFTTCSPFIFHRNIIWQIQYVHLQQFGVSLAILNHGFSSVSISASGRNPVTTLYSDRTLILMLERMVRFVTRDIKPLFFNYSLKKFSNLAGSITQYNNSGTLYNILSAPAFITVDPELLTEILLDNQIPSDTIKHCLSINAGLRKMFHNEQNHSPLIIVFRYNLLVKRATTAPFFSRSLSLLCGKDIIIQPAFFARELRNLADYLLNIDLFHIVLTLSDDDYTVPSIDCWCRQDSWMLQMDSDGFRLCDDPSIISAASISINQGIETIPAGRREDLSVYHYLTELAEHLETNTL